MWDFDHGLVWSVWSRPSGCPSPAAGWTERRGEAPCLQPFLPRQGLSLARKLHCGTIPTLQLVDFRHHNGRLGISVSVYTGISNLPHDATEYASRCRKGSKQMLRGVIAIDSMVISHVNATFGAKYSLQQGLKQAGKRQTALIPV